LSECTSLLTVAEFASPAPRTIAAAAMATPNVVFMKFSLLGFASVDLTPSEKLPIATAREAEPYDFVKPRMER
jgi:hypothetical protein